MTVNQMDPPSTVVSGATASTVSFIKVIVGGFVGGFVGGSLVVLYL